jgi:hypothetical protein
VVRLSCQLLVVSCAFVAIELEFSLCAVGILNRSRTVGTPSPPVYWNHKLREYFPPKYSRESTYS